MSESIYRLIRIRDHSDSDTFLTEPADNLTVERIAILRFIHDDFLKSAPRVPVPAPWTTSALKYAVRHQPGHPLHSDTLSGAKRAVCAPHLLVSRLIGLDMCAQSRCARWKLDRSGHFLHRRDRVRPHHLGTHVAPADERLHRASPSYRRPIGRIKTPSIPPEKRKIGVGTHRMFRQTPDGRARRPDPGYGTDL